MIINKLAKQVKTGLFILSAVLAFSSCQDDLTYEEAPESTYSEVGVTQFTFKARELFTDQIYAVNWEKWVDNYINTKEIGTTMSENFEIIEDSSVPDGKLYVINVEVSSTATYQTSNKGYLFDGSKFSGEFTLVDPVDNRSQQITLPIRKNEIIGEMYLTTQYNCIVEPQGDAPKLGVPADFSKASRYLVKNISYLPAGVQQYTRMYEVRVTFKP